jgi:hypothetical protein
VFVPPPQLVGDAASSNPATVTSASASRSSTSSTTLADLRGRVALLTGGRVKIGYQAALKLLRAGAHVIVTTRFPRDAAQRYAREPDFAKWGQRLEVHGLDLRHTPSVEAFCADLCSSTCERLDFIVNNACQTVRRPPEFYAHMMATSNAAARGDPAMSRGLLRGGHERDGVDRDRVNPRSSTACILAELSQVRCCPTTNRARTRSLPAGRLDADLQQVDLRA